MTPPIENTRIYLTGFMGTGKSTLGPAVADRLGWDFVDLDEVVTRRAGRTVPQIFAEEGEAGFRRREREALEYATGLENVVVGLGGGAVLDPANRARLLESGIMVCLTARLATLVGRVLSGSAVRPLLEDEEGQALVGDALIDRIRDLLRERSAAYSAAHVTVVSDEASVDETTDRILEAIRALDEEPAEDE